MTSAEAIQLHEATRAKIQSIYIKVTGWEEPPKGSRATRKKGAVKELWRMGLRERTCDRFCSFTMMNNDDSIRVYKSRKGFVMMRSFAENERRTLDHWDPQNPNVLALFFCGVNGTIDRLPVPWKGGEIPHIDLVPCHNLTQLTEHSELVLAPSDETPYVRLEVKATTRPYFTGFKIDLDPAHGYLIRRTLTGNEGMTEADEFKSYGDGIWIPNRIRTFDSSGGHRTTTEIDKCEVNGPIADKDLIVQFPEGARVEDREKNKIHLWGQGGPKQTFDTRIEFWKFVRSQWLPSLYKSVCGVFAAHGR